MIDSDFKFGLVALLIVTGLLCATAVVCMAIDAYRDCWFIEAGYTYKTLPGASCPYWVKEPSCERHDLFNKEDK